MAGCLSARDFSGARSCLPWPRRSLRSPRSDRAVDAIGRRPCTAVAGIHQLHDAHRRGQRQRRQLHDRRRLDDLRFLEPHPVFLQGSEGLLDPPPQPIQPHDLAGLGQALRPAVSSRAAIAAASHLPAHRPRPPRRWRGQPSLGRWSAMPLRPRHVDRPALISTRAVRPLSPMPFAATRTKPQPRTAKAAHRLEQRPACREPAILAGPDDEVDAVRLASEDLEDIALAVADDDHARSGRQPFGRAARRRAASAHSPCRRRGASCAPASALRRASRSRPRRHRARLRPQHRWRSPDG